MENSLAAYFHKTVIVYSKGGREFRGYVETYTSAEDSYDDHEQIGIHIGGRFYLLSSKIINKVEIVQDEDPDDIFREIDYK